MATFIGKYLNPGEVDDLLKIERDGRRKMRLNQVRQQAREKASEIVISVQKEKAKQIRILSNHLRAEWLRNKEERIEALGQVYGKSLNFVGVAHSGVYKEVRVRKAYTKRAEEDNEKIGIRGSEALNKIRIQKLYEKTNAIKHEDLRKAVRAFEDQRAKQVSALPPPQPVYKDEAEITPGVNIGKKQNQRLADSTSNELVKVIKTTAYDEIDAHLAAKLEAEKQADVVKQRMQEKAEQTKKERIRFLTAKSQMELQQEYNRIMNELEELAKQEAAYGDFEPDILLLKELQQDNIQLKQDQEAIVEELFSRLGISLTEPAFGKKSVATPLKEKASDASSENSKIQISESDTDATPVVHILTPDSSKFSTTFSGASSSSISTPGTGNSVSIRNRILHTSQIDPTLYSMEGETSVSEVNSRCNAWSASSGEEPVENVPVSSTTTNDETILAGHLSNHDLDSTVNVPALLSFDSSNSYINQKDSHYESTAGKIDNRLEFSQQNIFTANSNTVLKLDFNLQKHSVILDNQQELQARTQTSSSFGKVPVLEQSKTPVALPTNPTEPSVLNDQFKQLAFSNLLKSKGIRTSSSSTKRTDPLQAFHNVEVKQTNQNGPYKTGSRNANYAVINRKDYLKQFSIPSTKRQVQVLMPGASTLQTQQLATSIFSEVSTDLVTNIRQFTPNPLLHVSHDNNNFWPSDAQGHLRKDRLAHDLSTIVEVDTPNSSQQTCWQNSSTFSISKDLKLYQRVDPGYIKNEQGITDEPDLTLVSSECSTCFPDQSHSFVFSGISLSPDSFVQKNPKSAVEEAHQIVRQGFSTLDQIDQTMEKVKSPFLLINAKSVDKNVNFDDSDGSYSNRHFFPSFKKLSFLIGDIRSDDSLTSNSYADSFGKNNGSTPTISSTESHSCFGRRLLESPTLPTFSTPSLESISRSPHSFFHQNANLSTVDSQINSCGDEIICSNVPKPNFTSGDNLSTDDIPISSTTESMLSFIVNEQNAKLDHSMTRDTEEVSSDSKISTNDIAFSNRKSYFSSQSESISDSMISFLRHEWSADDGALSELGASPSLSS